MAALPTLPSGLRSSINQNLSEIVELHEELLGELHHAVPHSEYSQLEVPTFEPGVPPGHGHRRWRSLDAVPEDNGTTPWLHSTPAMVAEPQVGADVAKIFVKKVRCHSPKKTKKVVAAHGSLDAKILHL
jgi:hypothetical protein